MQHYNILLICLSFISPCLFAQQLPEANIKISPIFHYFDYTEFDQNGNKLNKESGFIPGLQLLFSVDDEHALSSFEFIMSVINGRVEYKGQTQSRAPFNSKTDETLHRFGFKYAWRSTNKPFVPERLYIAVTHNRWDRDIIGRGVVSDLSEIYTWDETAFGLNQSLYQNQNIQLLIDVSVLHITGPEIEVDLTPFGFGKPELDLGSRYGGRIQIQYQQKIINKIRLSTSLFFEGWNFGRSEPKTIHRPTGSSAVITEPRSETRHAGILFTLEKIF